MSEEQSTVNFLAWADDMIARQRAAGLTTGNVLNINALDELDPVHYRAGRNPERENDYDGDGGREHEDHLRDNAGGGFIGTTTFRPIADALPVIEAPSIVAELPATEPVKTESEGVMDNFTMIADAKDIALGVYKQMKAGRIERAGIDTIRAAVAGYFAATGDSPTEQEREDFENLALRKFVEACA